MYKVNTVALLCRVLFYRYNEPMVVWFNQFQTRQTSHIAVTLRDEHSDLTIKQSSTAVGLITCCSMCPTEEPSRPHLSPYSYITWEAAIIISN